MMSCIWQARVAHLASGIVTSQKLLQQRREVHARGPALAFLILCHDLPPHAQLQLRTVQQQIFLAVATQARMQLLCDIAHSVISTTRSLLDWWSAMLSQWSGQLSIYL